VIWLCESFAILWLVVRVVRSLWVRAGVLLMLCGLMLNALVTLCRWLGLPRGIENWFLTCLQQRLVKTGRRLVKHALLLAIAGGRTSEPAAIGGEVCPKRVRGRRCRKSGPPMAQFWRCGVRIAYRFVAFRMKIFSQYCEWRDWCMLAGVFEKRDSELDHATIRIDICSAAFSALVRGPRSGHCRVCRDVGRDPGAGGRHYSSGWLERE
jgi:hypothetical protein